MSLNSRFATAGWLAALALSACATDEATTWKAGHGSFSGWEGPNINGFVQIVGEVATPLQRVKGATAYCVHDTYVSHYSDPPRYGQHKYWDMYYLGGTVVEGSLPPGISMDEDGIITGIPTQRGNWIVKLRAGTYDCLGTIIGGETQQLIFKIGGSGVVYQ